MEICFEGGDGAKHPELFIQTKLGTSILKIQPSPCPNYRSVSIITSGSIRLYVNDDEYLVSKNVSITDGGKSANGILYDSENEYRFSLSTEQVFDNRYYISNILPPNQTNGYGWVSSYGNCETYLTIYDCPKISKMTVGCYQGNDSIQCNSCTVTYRFIKEGGTESIQEKTIQTPERLLYLVDFEE